MARQKKAQMYVNSAVRYLITAQKACPPGDWYEIVAMAVRDALSPDFNVRDKARRFLAKVLIPQDPVPILSTPDYEGASLEERLEYLRQLRERLPKVIDVVEPAPQRVKRPAGGSLH